MKPGLLLIVLLLAAGLAQAEPEALDQVNSFRQMAGLTPLAWNEQLAQAAKAHALYLQQNQAQGHGELPETPGFTGQVPAERALAAGYHSRMLWENLAQGQASLDKALEELMSAPYHRLGFLRLDADELGFYEKGDIRVFLLGNSRINALCQAEAPPQGEKFYFKLCRATPKTPARPVEQLTRNQQELQPNSLVWPPEGSQFVPPAFYDEEPDPMPDRAVKGYPVTIQLNPAAFKQPQLVRFHIMPLGSKTPLQARLYDAAGDPHARLQAGEYLLLPLDRMDWGQAYWAEAEFVDEGRQIRLGWQFSTKPAPENLIRLQGEGEWIWVQAGQRLHLFHSPSESHPVFPPFQTLLSKGVQADFAWADWNTLVVEVKGPPCGWVQVRYPPLRGFGLRLYPAAEGAACPPLAGE